MLSIFKCAAIRSARFHDFRNTVVALIHWPHIPVPALGSVPDFGASPRLDLDTFIFLHAQFISNPELICQMRLVRRIRSDHARIAPEHVEHIKDDRWGRSLPSCLSLWQAVVISTCPNALFSGANDHLGGPPLPFLNFIVSWVLLSCRNEDVSQRSGP